MNIKRYAVYAEFLNLVMIELFSVTFAWLIIALIGYPMTFWIPLLYSVILIFAFTVRCFVKKLSVYAVLHLTVVLGLFSLQSLLQLSAADRVAVIFFAVLWTILDFVHWAKADYAGIDMLPIWMMVLFLFTFFRAVAEQNSFLANEAYVCGIIYTGLFFLRLYCLNVKGFVRDKQMHEHVPVAMMFRQNGRMVTVLVCCFVLGMILIRSEFLLGQIMNLFQKIGDLIRQFLVWIISLLSEEATGQPPMEQEIADAVFPSFTEEDSFLTKFLYVLEVIVQWIFTLGCLYLIVRGIWRFFISYRNRNLKKEEEISYDGIKETKSWIVRNQEKRSKGIFQNLSNAEKVRRSYRKRIEQYRKKGYTLYRAHTPWERAKDIRQWKSDRENVDHLTELYEKARYSQSEISAEDVKTSKS